jgi:hypothetical protein
MNARRITEMIGRKRIWELESTIIGSLCGLIATKLIRAAYRATRKDDKTPDAVFDPTSSRFSWPDALLWAAAAGVGLGIAKVMSARLAAVGWEVATGTLPPGMEEREVG